MSFVALLCASIARSRREGTALPIFFVHFIQTGLERMDLDKMEGTAVVHTNLVESVGCCWKESNYRTVGPDTSHGL